MSGRFDWAEDEPESRAAGGPGSSAEVRRFWMLVASTLLVAGALWLAVRSQTGRLEQEARASIQLALDLAGHACRQGDGELFFTLQAEDPAWQASLLHPERFESYCAGLQVDELRLSGMDYAATLAWPVGNDSRRRLAFFQARQAGVRELPPPAAYWGEPRSIRRGWGDLRYGQADEPFAERIAAFIDERVAAVCAGTGCRPDARPFTLEIRPDFRRTAAPGLLSIPSPLLLGLAMDGQPAPEFWDALERELVAHLTPGVIRFAVPPLPQQVIPFEAAAADFMSRNPDVRIEIITLDTLPEEAGEFLAQYDGAAYTPTAAMVAAGLVYDITDFAASDPNFDQAGFVWWGARWRDRIWFLPHAGQVRLVYYDKNVFQSGGLVEPLPDWTWEELAGATSSLQSVPSATAESWSGDWTFLDATRDILFARAMSRRSGCDAPPAPCDRPLTPGDIAASLAWYRMMVTEYGMADAAATLPADRARLMANWQGVPRRAALWVDEAVNYEHYLQMWPVGVVPFPGAAGSGPIWAHGSFISAQSRRPRDVWRWLVFLSYRPLNGPLRYVPTRAAVAEQMGYYDRLPGPLRDVLGATIALARPVPFDQRELFKRDQIDAVLGGRPAESVAREAAPRWFGR